VSAQHTPGPWEWGVDDMGDGHVIRMGSSLGQPRPRKWEVQHFIAYDHGLTPEDGGGAEADQYVEAEANAKLIAAAPELLDLLTTAYLVMQYGVTGDDGFDQDQWLDTTGAVLDRLGARP
jgi:hypothetical protein